MPVRAQEPVSVVNVRVQHGQGACCGLVAVAAAVSVL